MNRQKQSGFVLFTGMVFMLILSILVLFLLRGSILEERMTANSMNKQRAIQAAEAALRDGETLAASKVYPFDPFAIGKFTTDCSPTPTSTTAGSGGYCRTLSDSAWDSMNWTASSTTTKASALSLSGVSQAPRYLIELITPPVWTDADGCSPATYRVIAKGWGQDSSEAVVQSHFQLRPTQCR